MRAPKVTSSRASRNRAQPGASGSCPAEYDLRRRLYEIPPPSPARAEPGASGSRPLVVGASCIAALVAAVVACGGPQHKTEGDGAIENRSSAADTRSAIEKRRDAACEQLGPKLTVCAVEDARADLAAGKVSKAQFDRDTAPDVQRKNTEEFLKACMGTSYSSRQIRVLEVCFREETGCAPLLDCLGHLDDPGANR